MDTRVRPPLLIFTATVEVLNCPTVARPDPTERFNDYVAGLDSLRPLVDSNELSLVVVENSGFDIERLLRAAGFSQPSAVPAVSYLEDPSATARGKGVGEARMFDRAFREPFDFDVDIVYKLTGRLRVSNLAKVIAQASPGRPFVRCRIRADLSFVDTRFFGAHPSVWRDELSSLEKDVDELSGQFLEHAVARRVTAGVARGALDRDVFERAPVFEGVSGSTGRAYGGLRTRIRDQLTAHLASNSRAYF